MNEALTPYPSPLMGRGGLNQRFLKALRLPGKGEGCAKRFLRLSPYHKLFFQKKNQAASGFTLLPSPFPQSLHAIALLRRPDAKDIAPVL